MKMSEHWQSTVSIENLQRRAAIIKTIRDFFADKNVLEVETPLLSWATVTDPHLYSIKAHLFSAENPFYLQTSPEFAMKRLLAVGSGPIYQITKSFRDDEVGRLHNPEFTMLEWYRPGFNHHQLMDEMDELLQLVLSCKSAKRLSYQDVFKESFGINPHVIDVDALRNLAHQQGLQDVDGIDNQDKDVWLMRLMSDVIEPRFNGDQPYFVYDFPASQAALSQLNDDNGHPVASRFEVYYQGMELANGFHELSDAAEQRKRFENDLAYRKANGLPMVPMDQRLLEALDAGFPDCAGVALGVDRLVMLALGCDKIEEVIAFPVQRA